jgi:hypothetical protein
MRGRTLAAAVVMLVMVAIAIATVGASAGASAKESLRCASSGRTIARNGHVRVFRVGPPDQYSAYACVLPRGRVRHLGDYEGDGSLSWDGVYGFKLAGNFVAYEDALCDHSGGCGGGSLKSFDVVTRKMVHRARIPGGEAQYYVLVLNGHGSIAWMRTTIGSPEMTLWKCDAPNCVVLDRNHPRRNYYIDASSLKLQGHTLHWTHADGTASSAPLK